MQNDLRRLLDIAALAAKDAEWLGLRRRKTSQTYYMARDAEFDDASAIVDEGIMVEALYNGSFGYAASSDMSTESIASAALSAVNNAKAVSNLGIYNFTKSVRPATVTKFETKRQRKATLAPNYLFDILIDSCKEMKNSEEIIQTSALFEFGKYDYEIVSTNGADIEQSLYYIGSSLQAVARRADLVQQRTFNGPRGYVKQGGWEVLNPNMFKQDAKRVGLEAIELLNAEPCPNDKRTLVLMPNQLMLQIHESCGHALELDRILGDERNFAGGSFIKPADFGNFQYGSKLMNVVFDPTVEGELASYGADEIGNLARKEYLIKDGILVRGLGSLESQERSNLKGVANQRSSSWNRAPIDRMANINIEPGTSSFDQIISGIEKGILMDANRSWSIDDYRNKFQFGCEYGKLIENGKITKTVRDPNYRGISSNFWRNLSAVGDKDTFQIFATPNCGKGEPNQIMFVGHASPVCAFNDIDVFGGEK